MRLRILQNDPEVPAGSIVEWLARRPSNRPIEWRIDKLFEGEPVPSVDEFDWAISLGGGMNCDEEKLYPYLLDQKRLLVEAVERKKAVLGLCLGGQLLARALGAEVRQHEGWEAGWHPVQLANASRLVTFQWHQDAFEVPTGAQRIATGAFCPNQGFLFGDCAVGLQFHPEATEDWIVSCCQDPQYPAGPHVQRPEQILEEIGFLSPLRKWFFSLLDQMERVAQASKAAAR